MTRDLTNSSIERKNILNNNIAIEAVYNEIGFMGIMFEEKYRFTKLQIANYYEVDIRTIDRLMESHKSEIEQNGYELFSGTRLRKFKKVISDFISSNKDGKNVHDINVVNIVQMYENEHDSLQMAPQLGVFTYKAFLNIGMLLTNSEKAQRLRSFILDIVIDVLNKKLGGKTKYINQRDEEFLPSAIREYNYRKTFTNCLDKYITENKFKYSQLTDKIYLSIFKENAKEYRQILNLTEKESVRKTMYSEVLDLVSSYENGFAKFLKDYSEKIDRKLSLSEAIMIFSDFENLMEAVLSPLREKARSLMASRDLAFRDALHEKLKDYISEVSAYDYDKFLGERSMELQKRLEENEDVFKRLKDR